MIRVWYCLWTAIILPEQSVAADKGGLAVNKRGVTLKELLQQSSHRNAKVRKGIQTKRWQIYLFI